MTETHDRPVILAPLGGIGSGKSTVSHWLAGQGAAVLDADEIARECLAEPEVTAALRREFGPGVVGEGGTSVDRAALADAVFGQPEALEFLEGLVHPRVQRHTHLALWKYCSGQPTVPAVVLDIPLLIEKSPLRKHCDLLIFVECPRELRRQRVDATRGWSAAELERREGHQASTEEKRRVADLVVHNHGSVAELVSELKDWLQTAGGFAGLPRRGAPLPPPRAP